MAEDFEDRLRRHEEMIQALARVWTRQGEINERMDMHIERMDRHIEQMDIHIERMDGYIAEQRLLNAELVGIHRNIDTRLERIERILERMLPGSTNGRQA